MIFKNHKFLLQETEINFKNIAILTHVRSRGIPRRLSLACPSPKSHLLWQEIMAFVQLLYDPCYSLLLSHSTSCLPC